MINMFNRPIDLTLINYFEITVAMIDTEWYVSVIWIGYKYYANTQNAHIQF